MRKVIVDFSGVMHHYIAALLPPGIPTGTDIETQTRIKLRGEWLPDKFETPPGELIQTITIKELRAVIGGVK